MYCCDTIHATGKNPATDPAAPEILTGKIMQVKTSTLENGNVLVSKTYFDGEEMVTDTLELTEIGAYVYVINPNGTTSQVCEGLRPTGPTLMAGNDLAETVRRTLGF